MITFSYDKTTMKALLKSIKYNKGLSSIRKLFEKKRIKTFTIVSNKDLFLIYLYSIAKIIFESYRKLFKSIKGLFLKKLSRHYLKLCY